MGWTKSGRLGAALCCVVLLLPILPAAAATPTAQELLAEADQTLVNQLVEWDKRAFDVPDDLALDEPLRDAATAMVQDHVARVRELLPAWIAQERAESRVPDLRGGALFQPIYRRLINEMAIWSVESGGPAHDDAWLKAVLAPKACSVLPPFHFGRRIAMIQAAPVDVRPALLAAERQLLSRWGTKRQGLLPRPSATDLDAADQAITRIRAGLPVTAGPMTPYLAGQIFDRDRKPGPADRWQQCAKSQWWLASQLAGGKTDRTLAIAVYRYSTMIDVHDFVPDSVIRKAAAARPTEGQQAYPPVAAHFNVEGSTTVQAETDDHGRLLKAQVISREIKVPGVRDNPPVAFETLLDAAALDYAAKRSYPDAKAARQQFVINWRLQ
jgi:hypothetical protein